MKRSLKTTKIEITICKPLIVLPILCTILVLLTNIGVKNREVRSVNLTKVLAMKETQYEKVLITRVIDGDTFETIDKRKIRVVGVNAPEDTTTKERFGEVATLFAKETLEGKFVYIEKDTSETDKYDRLLRHIWLTKPNENERNDYDFIKENSYAGKLLDLGYGKPMSIDPDISLKDTYTLIAQKAKDKKLGLWGINSTTKGDF